MASFAANCESHLERLLSATSEMGGAFWPSVVDTRTGRLPAVEHVPQRVYRLIGAPQGSTLYWDQPMIVAAHALSERSGHQRYAGAADDYLHAFLSHCVADNGVFRWGNHAYYDVCIKQVVEFHEGHHELRPITPAWDVFWRNDPQRTARYIRQVVARHVYDADTGGFNRHDDGKRGHAFIEAGGILVESLSWLYGKTGETDLLDRALRIARYSYGHRDPSTGLMPNEPDMGRWDSNVCTSEIGVWAQSLLRAQKYTNNGEFAGMVYESMSAYLDYAFDPVSGEFFGQVGVRDGKPVVPEQPGYWPREYANAWNTDQWPTHDYPMAVGEACLSLYAGTNQSVFLDNVRRLAAVAMGTRPGLTNRWAYAEHYGRCIHFLTRAGLLLGDEQFLSDAQLLADEAMERLWENGMFRGYPSAHVYESVDGVGILILALLFLETRQPPNTWGLGF